jgi:ubiquinone/menaquinone biosynthesis C-methylase UbiE
MEPFDASVVRAAYDTGAEDYSEAFADDLLQLRLDRQVLDAAVTRIAEGEFVLDLGCGPGQVGRYLAERDTRKTDSTPPHTSWSGLHPRRFPRMAISGGGSPV